VITADDVETLVFNVLGTVVDEAGSMRAELAAALDQADASRQAEALSAAWARRFGVLVSAIGEGAPWRSTDDLNAEALADVLRDGPQLPEATSPPRTWPPSPPACSRRRRRNGQPHPAASERTAPHPAW
jgi:2-haloacid dehalogenase